MKRKNVIKHVSDATSGIHRRIIELGDQITKERAWAAVLEKRIADIKVPIVQFERRAAALDKMLANDDLLKVDELLKKVNWMHERIDLLANRLDEHEKFPAPGMDAIQIRRLMGTVSRFDERLLRLEHPSKAKALPLVNPRKRRKP